MYAVAGVTGNTGSVVAEELLRRGKPVRVIVRSEEKGAAWRAKGAEVAVASIDDAEALTQALAGADGAYLLNPPDLQNEDMRSRGRHLGEVFARAVKGSGVKHVVLLSSIGAQHDSGTGPIVSVHLIEQALLATGINLTFLRPTYFIENWGSVLGVAAKDGILPSFLELGHAIPMVATADIGKVAAEALENPPQRVRIIELAGPEDYTPEAIAAVLTPLVGKPVTAVPAPLEAVVPTYTQFGISPHVAELFREMYDGVNRDHVAWDGKGERRRGTTPPSAVFQGMLG
ncbi:MAG TPA: NmrA family NAD(P)-binding protein [Thermoanaerobaculia bacterium]|nr:NmrA family NAD(P)-binding protein [Thermoanaerobaculia bacterium]